MWPQRWTIWMSKLKRSQIDIIVGSQNLSDTFEWDLNSTVTPEEFACLHVKELGLSGEFALVLLRGWGKLGSR